MPQYQKFDNTLLDAAGLNLQAVFNLADLPDEVAGRLDAMGQYQQLILLGHGGRAMWEAVRASGIVSDNPIDDFSCRVVAQWFATCLPGQRHQIVYPGPPAIGLQALGKLAGWHHASPFMVGINATWGSWYAYRAVVLADTRFAPSQAAPGVSPCAECRRRACLAACPAGALDGAIFSLEKCLAWRKQPASPCRYTCLARCACPVAGEQRYSDEQLRHTYAISLRMIEQGYAGDRS